MDNLEVPDPDHRRTRAAVREHCRHHRRHALHPGKPPRAQTCALYVKAEFFNPASSVKDRLAISIIEEAERRGELKPGQTVVEATSGNTGIGLALVCAPKGYPLVVTMADSFSIERRKLMRFLGAKVVLTPRAAKGLGMYQKARELADATAGSSPRSSRRRPMPRSMKTRPRERSWPILLASGSTTSSPATARVARSQASAAC